ncbi:MAG TPA: hypothetical protein VJV74_16480 [Terriglobia bacterium]|nr:hypothetical protein [Terriglobia bacterium]
MREAAAGVADSVEAAFMAGLGAEDSGAAVGSAGDFMEAAFAVDLAAADSGVGLGVGLVEDLAEEGFEVDGVAEDFVAASVAGDSGALAGFTVPSSAIDLDASDSTLMILLSRRGFSGLDHSSASAMTTDIRTIRMTGAIPTVLIRAVRLATVTIRTRTVPTPTIRLPMRHLHTLRP